MLRNIENQEEILFVSVSYGETQGSLVIPGGFVERGETLTEAVIREIEEETNVKVEPDGIVGIRTMVQETHLVSDIYVTFKCHVIGSHKIRAQEGEISEIIWIPTTRIFDHPRITDFTKYTISQVLSQHPMKSDHKVSQERWKRKRLIKNEQYWVNR